jgi:hypothetical protein
MRTLIVFLCMAGAALAQQRRQQEPPTTDRAALGKVKKDQVVDVSIRGGTEIGYDDNFLDLNDKQIKQLEAGSHPGKFKIDEPDDMIYTLWAEVRLKGKFLSDTTQAGLKVQPYFYLSNSIANYEEYQVFLRQNVGKDTAGIEYEQDRDVYLRELRHFVGPWFAPTYPYDSARYTEHTVEAFYRHQVVPAVSVRGGPGYRIKDFDPMFNFRDISGYFIGVGPIVDLGGGVEAFLRYEFSTMNAEASSEEADTSHRQHEVEVGASAELFRRVDVSLKYRVGFREYTSNSSPLDDPSHVGRDDVRHKICLRARVKLSASWSLHVEYVYRHDDSRRPFDDDSTTSEPGNSTRNVVTIGATFIF